uniref:Platelet-derived growth factor (PDGF) family profile domain-containing protein n=1 Tax=Strix occidentalis caurina TaxID=311401 RepID=A0A8D0FE26_STROC
MPRGWEQPVPPSPPRAPPRAGAGRSPAPGSPPPSRCRGAGSRAGTLRFGSPLPPPLFLAVLTFRDIWNRSLCRPLEQLVDVITEFPNEVEYIFRPSCVSLRRCGGCCGDEGLRCVPVETSTVTMQVSSAEMPTVVLTVNVCWGHGECEGLCQPCFQSPLWELCRVGWESPCCKQAAGGV